MQILNAVSEAERKDATAVPGQTSEQVLQPRRRYWRSLSLRTAFGLLSICAVIFAYPAWLLQDCEREKRLGEEIETQGGIVRSASIGKAWLTSIVGESRTQVIDDVRFIDGQMPTDSGLLSRCKYLRRLRIEDCDLQDSDVSKLGRHSHLRELSLRRTSITDRSIPAILQCHSLETIDLERTQVTAAGVSRLRQLPQLKEVKATYFSPGELEAAELGNWRALQIHWKAKRGSTARRLTPAKLSAYLTPNRHFGRVSLVLNGSVHRFSTKDVADIVRYPDLEFLGLFDLDVDPIAFSVLPKLEQLQELRIADCSGAEKVFQHVGKCSRLEKLSIKENSCTPEHLAALNGLSNLRFLKLESRGLRDEGLLALRELPQMEELELWHCNVTSDGLRVVERLPKLRRLKIFDADASDRLIPVLAECGELSDVELSSMYLRDEGQLLTFAKMPWLKRLSIKNDGPGSRAYAYTISPRTVQELKTLLPHCEIDAR